MASSSLDSLIRQYSKGEAFVKIKNKKLVENLLTRISEKGSSNLQIVADFDGTLSRYYDENDGLCDSSYDVLDKNSLMSEEFRRKVMADYHKFGPAEIDPSMTLQEKIDYMIKWYKSYEQNLLPEKLNKAKILDLVNSCNAFLRDGSKDALEFLNEENIPVLIFSAGLGDIISGLLNRDNVLLPNMKIVANYMKFDEDDNLTGLSERVVHVFNKNETLFGDKDSYFYDLAHRKNAIVIGDSIGDASMANGMHDPENILKIGFLNKMSKEKLEMFEEAYDIVIIEDQTMEFVNLILHQVIKQ